MRAAFVSVIAVLLIALAAPPVVLVLAWKSTGGSTIEAPEPPVYSLETSARVVTVGATASATWESPMVVRAPNWHGLVTGVLVAPGDVLEDGIPIARVDGVEVRHFTLESPLYGPPMCQGDTAQVTAVRSVLSAAGLSVGSTQRLSSKDVVAIRQYAVAIGVADGQHVTCFDPGWVAISTEPVGTIVQVDLSVGMPAPTQGEPILTGRASLVGLSLVGDTGATSIDAYLSADDSSTFASTELLISGRATGVGIRDLAKPEALAELASLLDPTVTSTEIAVALSLSDSQYVVPATAVVAPLGPEACIFPASAETRSIPVIVVASSISGLVIDLGTQHVEVPVRVTPGSTTCV